MPSRFALTLLALASTAGGVLVSCGDGPTAPGDPPRVVFSVGEIAFGTGRDLTIELSNPGGRAVGPVQLLADPIRDEGGALVPASELQVSPELVPTLNPGSSVVVRLELVLPDGLGGGAYHSALEARGGAQGSVTTQVPVSFQVSQAPPPPSGPGGISIA
ncbi:MAG TPA: hypothetical protein VLL48_06470, partial [Longimicrobiales bacterium]|nr:hypothetical protein [Longimicrobiales bacterium]